MADTTVSLEDFERAETLDLSLIKYCTLYTQKTGRLLEIAPNATQPLNNLIAMLKKLYQTILDKELDKDSLMLAWSMITEMSKVVLNNSGIRFTDSIGDLACLLQTTYLEIISLDHIFYIDYKYVFRIGFIVLFLSSVHNTATQCYDVWKDTFRVYVNLAEQCSTCLCQFDVPYLKTVLKELPKQNKYRTNGARNVMEFTLNMIKECITDRCGQTT
ncbi:MAG: hypothetical protein CMP20_04525 [Rickettsiales bacterium]|nr:hypothetical protein [Rickettsiales bacterium]